MKKFISILTTACIAASSMVGATMSSVNAADTMLFTYKAADGTSTVTVDVSGGDATVDASLWITEYAPVYTMGLKMTWYGADGTGYLPEDNPYFTGTKVGYTDPHVFIDPIWEEAVLYKIKNANALPMNFVWQMGTVGEDQSTPIDAVPSVDGEFQFIDMTFTVDADTPAGTYTLDIRRESFALDDQGTLSSTKLNNVAGETVEYNTVPLTIVVTNGEEEETTTTTSASEEEVTTTTTTQTTPDQGDTTTAPTIEGHTYQIGMVEVDLATFADTDYIQVPVQVYGDTNTAGITMGLDVDETLAGSYVRYKVGDAYDGAPTFNKDTFYYVWASSNGKNTTAADGATIITLWFKLPEGAAAGDVYPISFNFDMVVGDQAGEDPHVATQSADENGNILDIKYNNGWVKIVDGAGEEETTTTPAETTTTEEVTTTTEEVTTTTEEVTTTTTSASEEEVTTTTTTVTVPAGDVLPGDTNVDGRVSIADVVKLNKYLAGNDDLTDQGLANAEVNADGKIDNADSIKIMQFLAKMIEQSELGKA